MGSLFRTEAIESKFQTLLGETLQITPVHFSVVAIVVFLIALCLLAFIFLGTYTHKETVTGVLNTTESNVRIYPQNSGIVSEIFVTEGQSVVKGQALILLSAARNSYNGETIETNILTSMQRETQTLIQQIARQNAIFDGRKQTLELEVSSARVKLELLEKQLINAKDRLGLKRRNHDRFEQIQNRGSISPSTLEQLDADLLMLEQEVTQFEMELLKQQYIISQGEITLTQLPFLKEGRISELQTQLDRQQQRILEAEGRESLVIVATTAGKISGLNIRAGQRVLSSQPLLSILPSQVEFYAELYVPSRFIGFISEGTTVNIRYDAFPHQKFGVYPGVLDQISRTVVRPNELIAPIAISEPSYVIRVRLQKQNVQVYGVLQPLQVGMTLQADILRDKRSIAEWLFDPLVSAVNRL